MDILTIYTLLIHLNQLYILLVSIYDLQIKNAKKTAISYAFEF